ncbi:ABC transporter substrate-binding protein [Ramlibacter albus]|uniref:ABC transporter substrate-binding protein n=1 Tax=Ramlibacter albus TaxID=2079448 RepID=A0A923M8P1_9BURK|nr:ABC transporter substrate-binding protein [Ramlibacter albus]MBC5764938.1 ABC transporter substrate-binding protein [Ramlibacter albus]
MKTRWERGSWKKTALAFALVCAGAQAQVMVGQTAGFTGPVAAGVKETTEGARLWFDAVNAKGGIAGQPVELVSLDDKFDPKLAAENAKQLVEQRNVVALFLTRGTPHTQAVLPLLEAHKVPLVAPSTGAMVLHEPVPKYVFNVRATYQREAEKAVEHLHTLGMRRIAVVHADDSFGADALAGANKGFAKTRMGAAAVVKADREKPDYAKIVPVLTAAQAQAVLWIGSAKVVAQGVKALRGAKSAAHVVTLSNNASSGFIKELGEHSRGVIVTQVFPNERSIAYPMVKEAMELAKAKGVELSPAMLEGYAAAKVLVEGLKRAGKNPTREKLQAALEGMKRFDLGGLEVTYGPADHTGLDFADLSIVDLEGRFVR